MKVIFQTSIAGHADKASGFERDFAFQHGQEAELPDAIAEKWIASKIAVPVGGKAVTGASGKPSKKAS